MASFRDLLADGRVHVFDGAMGTMLYTKGFFLNVCYDELNLKQPKLVQEIHVEYVRAGAEILETNTFGANPVKLSGWGLADQTEAVNRTAAELARGAAGSRGSVTGAIRPPAIRIATFRPTARAGRVHSLKRPARGPPDGRAGSLLLATFSELEE